MKHYVILLLFMLMYNGTTAQIRDYSKVVQKDFNWGFRTGFTATNSNFYQIYQKDTEIGGNIINQAGFQYTVFGRINLGKFFLQPDLGYYLIREKHHLNLPIIDSNTQQELTRNVVLGKSSQSLNAAMLLGYNVVKSDAYIFNFYLGPNFRYNYVDKYEYNINDSFDKRNPEHKLNLVAGVSANISYFHIDFKYEVNIPAKSNTSFSGMVDAPDYLKNISIQETKNILSFSLGMMF